MPTNNRIESLTQLDNKSFQLQIDRLPSTVFYCTSAPLPGVSLSAVLSPTPFTKLKVHGDGLIFQPLVVTFIVDENLQNWKELFNWMVSQSTPNGFDQYANTSVSSPRDLYASKKTDATLLIPNNKYNIMHEVIFEDVTPIDLSDLLFDVQIDDIQTQVCTVTFEFTQYYLKS